MNGGAEQLAMRRIPMPDVARFFGIVLVYYGHIIERIMYLKDPTATMHYKLIYSFHMAFFFLLSGFIFNADKLYMPLNRFFRKQVASRLVPYFVFSAVLVVLSLLFKGHFVVVDLSTVQGYLQGGIATLLGFPVFNIPLWFMACLFSVELIHFVVGRYLKSDAMLIAAAVVTYLSGYYLTLYVQFLPGPNFWFLHEALVVYSFYLVGVLLRRRGIFMAPVQRLILVPVFVACALAVWFTFNLNTGPFRLFDAVVIVLSGHGHVFWFMFTALCGSMMLLVLANLCGRVGIFRFMGRNGLILFCLNGVFYHFFNGPFAEWFMQNYTATPFTVTLAGCLFTLVSLAACVPLVLLLERYVPQLVGRPAMRGPLLPALVKA